MDSRKVVPTRHEASSDTAAGGRVMTETPSDDDYDDDPIIGAPAATTTTSRSTARRGNERRSPSAESSELEDDPDLAPTAPVSADTTTTSSNNNAASAFRLRVMDAVQQDAAEEDLVATNAVAMAAVMADASAMRAAINALQAEIDESREHQSRDRQTNRDAEAELAAVRAELRSRQERIAELEEDLEAARDAAAAAEEDLVAAAAATPPPTAPVTVATARVQCDLITPQQLDQLRADLAREAAAERSRALEKLRAELEAAHSQALRALSSERDTLRARVDAMQDDEKNAKSNRGKLLNEVAAYEKRLLDRDEENRNLVKRVAAAEAEAGQLKGELAAAVAVKSSELDPAQLAELQAAKAALANENEELREIISEHETEIALLRKRANRTEQQLASTNSNGSTTALLGPNGETVEDYDRIIRNLKDDRANLTNQLEKALERNKYFSDQLAKSSQQQQQLVVASRSVRGALSSRAISPAATPTSSASRGASMTAPPPAFAAASAANNSNSNNGLTAPGSATGAGASSSTTTLLRPTAGGAPTSSSSTAAAGTAAARRGSTTVTPLGPTAATRATQPTRPGAPMVPPLRTAALRR